MANLTPQMEQTLKTFPQHTVRYLSIAPRQILFQAQVDTSTVFYDNQSGGYFALKYQNPSGNAAACEPDMTVLVGTSVGADDIAKVRLRGAINTSSLTIPISETPYGDLPLTETCFVTVLNLFEPATRLIRLVGIKTGGSQFENDFIEYHDYDQAYTNQNQRIRPIVNIFSHMHQNLPILPKYAGWADAGQNFRVVTLRSEVINIGIGSETIAHQWNIRDCQLQSGSLTSNTVTLRVPVGFRYVKLTVTNGGGLSQVKHIPLWTHNDNFPPLAEGDFGFNITSDQSEAGRQMDIDIFGSAITETAIPKGALMCYWEQSTNEIDMYRGQFWGWVYNVEYGFKEFDVYKVKLGGIAQWMQRLVGFGTQMNTRTPPSKWFEMPSITLARFVHYLLREYSTVLNLCNFYPDTSATRQVKTETANRASLWEQCRLVCEAYGMRQFKADTNNSLWITPHPSYMKNGTFGFQDQKSPFLNSNAIYLTPEDIDGDTNLAFNEDVYKPIGRTDGTGDIWIGAAKEPTVVASRAPSKSSGQGEGTDDLPYQRLEGTNEAQAQAELNWLVGQHYARKNSYLQNVSITLIGNYDVFDPAWNNPVYILWQPSFYPNLTGKAVFTPFNVVSVSVDHAADRGTRRKTIKLTLEEITSGIVGVTVPIPKGQWVDNPMWDFFWKVNPALPDFDFQPPITRWENTVVGFAVAGDKRHSRIGRSFNFESSFPTWENITPAPLPSGAKLYSLDGRAQGSAIGVKAFFASSSTGYIYSTPDVLAERVVWREETSFPLGSFFFDEIGAIKADADSPYWCVSWVCTDGVRVKCSPDGGAWGAPVIVGSNAFISQSLVNKNIGLDILDGTILITGKDALGNWRIYTGGGLTPTFTQSAENRTSPLPWHMLKWGPMGEYYASSLVGTLSQTVQGNITLTESLEWNAAISGHTSPFDFWVDNNNNINFVGNGTGWRGYDNIIRYVNSVGVTQGFYTNPPLINRIRVSDYFGNGINTPRSTANISGLINVPPWRTAVSMEFTTDRGIFSRYVVWTTRQYAFTPSAGMVPGQSIIIMNGDMEGDTSDITIREGDDFTPFRLRSFRIRRFFLDEPSMGVIVTENRFDIAQDVNLTFNPPVVNRVSESVVVAGMPVPPNNVNFFVSYEFAQMSAPAVSMYLPTQGGVYPYTRNGLSVDFASQGTFSLVGRNSSTEYIEGRSQGGVYMQEQLPTEDVRGVKRLRSTVVVFGDDMMQMKWKYNTYDNKMGNWEQVVSQNPEFVDMVVLL